MKPSLWQSAALAGCLLLSACQGSRNDVQVVSRNFDEEIEQQQNLQFSFNKDLYPDSLLRQWDQTAYIDFKPRVNGVFKWNSSSELVFSPSEGFQPGTEYTATVTREVLKKSKKQWPLSRKREFRFHTAPLRVQSSTLSWTRGKSNANVMVQLDLQFNYDVKLQEAASRLRLSSKGQPVNFTAVTSGTGKMLSVQLMPLNEKDEMTPLKAELGKGIPIAGGKYQSSKDTILALQVPSRYNLEVTGVDARHSGTEGTIDVTLSQPVSDAQLKQYIQLEPSVPFEVSSDESGFSISGKDFNPETTYQLTISNALEGSFGGRFKKNYSEAVSFGRIQPAIRFVNEKGMYLSSQGYRNLALNLVNIPKVKVSVVKVYENNLEHLMRSGRDQDYGYTSGGEEGGDGDWFNYYRTQNLGDTIFQQEYDTRKLPGNSFARVLHLDFQDKIRSYSGIYVITVASSEHYWIQQSKILSLSDIGMIVKEDKDNVYVFANSIRYAKPLSNVKVSFISTNNQLMHQETTNGDGVAVFRNIAQKSPGFHVGMITAKAGDEFSFVWLEQSAVETSRYDVGGRTQNAAGLNAYIYAERNLYRPGETVHVSTIVRDEQWNNPGEVPVKLKLNMPNGKEFATMRKILNEQGSCETIFPIPASALTGTYTLEVYTGNDVLLNAYDFSIEEFMPDRIKAQLNIDKQEYVQTDTLRASIQADNLFGTPAMNRNYQCELNMDKVAFSSDKYGDYSFATDNSFYFSTLFRSGATDERGQAKESFSLNSDGITDAGMLKGNVMATVFDENGRPVHRYAHFTLYTQPVFVGVKQDDYYVGTRRPVRLGLIALDKNQVPQNNVQVQVTLLKKEWHTVIEQNGSRYRYVSKYDTRTLGTYNVNVSGTASAYVFTPTLGGEYEVRIARAGSNAYISRTFYAWGYDDTQYTSFEVNNEGSVDIKPDKPKYAVGENINLLFTTPFEGRMLVSVERDKVIEYHYLTTKDKSAVLRLKAGEEHLPNIYVSATLFRPMDGTDMPLTVAHGYEPVLVDQKKNQLPVQVSMAASARSKTKQTITVKTAPGAYVTVAAVDEGILQVKNYQTPDPYQHFYQKVALAVAGYDIYPLLLPEVRTSSTGGDGAGDDAANRVNPLFVNRARLVSFWSGILQADGSGTVRYSIDVPQFSGDLRVMAVAYKGRAFGGADQHMKVADPVVISTALPRFLSPNDQVLMPVTLSNTTAKDAVATVTVKTEGPIGMTGGSTQKLNIPANREARAVFNVAAQRVMGAGKVTVSVQAMNETFTDETDISIRPPASLQKQTGSGLAKENSLTSVTPVGDFIPASYSGKLIVARSPLVQFSRNMDELVHYPYGCVEQTTSAAFPQLYYADLVRSISGQNVNDPNPAYNVQQAILKLQSMQLSNGALCYWPDGGYESWWGSVYAAHFLLEARKAGFEVNGSTLDRLMQYLKFRLKKKENITYRYNGNQERVIVAKEVPYSLYVLALAGEPQQGTMNYYKGNPGQLSLDGRYLLAAAYGLSGQPVQAKQVLPASFSGEKSERASGGSFYSYIRDEALALSALLDIDPGNPQTGIMARQVAEQMKREPYLSTQENVFGILAMGKMARAANKTSGTASVLIDGKQVATTQGANLTLDLKPYRGKPLQVQVKGNGPFYYFWEVKGVTADGHIKEEDSYMKVRRAYFNRTGQPIAGNSFRQNDLIVVRLSLQGQYNSAIDNVVVTDMLPAGFEIENTRLNDMPDLKWIKDASYPDYLDYRDDRLNLFTTAGSEVKNYYYMVRAVSPGTYTLGPVQADAMYNGYYHSYHGAGVVQVTER